MALLVVLEDVVAEQGVSSGGEDHAESTVDRVRLRSRLSNWWARVPVSWRVAGVVFIVVRVLLWMVVHRTYVFADTHEFRPVVGAGDLSYVSFLGSSYRPWVVPLVYALLPNDEVRVIFQVLFSVVAWLVLALTLGRAVRSSVLAAVAFVAVLVFGLSIAVTSWDFVVLSESLAISVGALTIAAWINFARSPSTRTAVLVGLATTIFVFIRPQLFPVVAVVAVVLAVSSIRSAEKVLRLGLAGVLVLVVLWGLGVVDNIERYSAGRQEQVGTFTQNFSFVVERRIQPFPERLAWFRDQGMPDPSVLPPPAEDITARMRDFGAYPIADWAASHGQLALARYSIEHPNEFPLQFGTELPSVLVPKRENLIYANEVPTVLPGPVEAVLSPTSSDPTKPMIPPQALFVVLFAATLALPRRSKVDRGLLGVALGFVGVGLAGLYISWLVSTMEPERHAIPFTTLVPLMLLVASIAFIDAAIGSPGDRESIEHDEAPATIDLGSANGGRAMPVGEEMATLNGAGSLVARVVSGWPSGPRTVPEST